jgi:hypothetical protein
MFNVLLTRYLVDTFYYVDGWYAQIIPPGHTKNIRISLSNIVVAVCKRLTMLISEPMLHDFERRQGNNIFIFEFIEHISFFAGFEMARS